MARSTRRARASPWLLNITCWTWNWAWESLMHSAGRAWPDTLVHIWPGGYSSTVICTCWVRQSVGRGWLLPTPEQTLWGRRRTIEAFWGSKRALPVAKLPPRFSRSSHDERDVWQRRAFWSICWPDMKYWEEPP